MISERLLRRSKWARWDALQVGLALAQGWVVLSWPSIGIVALGLWWNANTISHQFIHRPLFRKRALNRAFSWYLSVLLGFPHSLWRARHLKHHGARQQQSLKLDPLDFAAAAALWVVLFALAPTFTLLVYLPGFATGLALCFLQGHYEHVRGTVSHYGWLYNALFFNDGYHVEHHTQPGAHWRDLPTEKATEGEVSCWPAVLRWIECFNLCALERLVLRSTVLQRFVVDRHEQAFRRLLGEAAGVRSAGIVGGGLFPRTAVILNRLLPEADLALIDMSFENLQVARKFFAGEIELINKRFCSSDSCSFDLLVVPLAFSGSREAIYERPPAPAVIVHDWIWRRRGNSAVVSWLLLKRLNLVKQ